MKRITLLVFLLPIALFSQTNDSIKTMDILKPTPVSVQNPDRGKETKTSNWEIGFSASPDYCFRKLTANEESKDIKEIRDTLEVPKIGFTAGVNLYYHLNKHIVLETGILFSDKGEKTKKTSFVDVPQGQKVMYYTYKYNYRNVDIPLKVEYYLLTGKLKLYVTAGVSANIFLNQKTTVVQGHDKTDWEKASSISHPKFNRINFALLAGAGINYKINDKLTFIAEPNYSRSLTPIINAPVKEYLYSYGLTIGISRKL